MEGGEASAADPQRWGKGVGGCHHLSQVCKGSKSVLEKKAVEEYIGWGILKDIWSCVNNLILFHVN